jgi:hypothetical protein
MRLPLPTISSKLFTFNPETNTFSAFASDLKGLNFHSPIYDDACDCGFAMVSERTGIVATWALSYEADGPDGGVESWEFKAVGPFNGVLFGLRNTLVVIFND